MVLHYTALAETTEAISQRLYGDSTNWNSTAGLHLSVNWHLVVHGELVKVVIGAFHTGRTTSVCPTPYHQQHRHKQHQRQIPIKYPCT